MVDPITVTYSVVNTTGSVLAAARALSSLRAKYQNAANTITAICAESSVISASLSQIQGLLLRDAAHLESHFDQRPELRETFDTALTGCTIVYACLEDEIERLQVGARDADAVTWKVKCRFIWREDTMRDILSQLRGQQTALNLLIQMLQLESLSDLKRLMRDNNQIISRVAQRSKSLRQSYPSVRVSSVFSRDDTAVDAASTIDQTEFEFDDTIVNSRAYRRALAAARQRPPNARSASEPTHDIAADAEKLDIKAPAGPLEEEGNVEAGMAESPPLNAHGGVSDELESKDALEAAEKGDDAETTTVKGLDLDPQQPETPEAASVPQEQEEPQKTPPLHSKRGSEDRIPALSPVPCSPRPAPRPVHRKPLPSTSHVLLSSPSMSTLSSSSAVPTPSQETKEYVGSDAVSRVSTATTTTPSIFSASSNPATGSSVSLPRTIESTPKSDSDDDAETLIEPSDSLDPISEADGIHSDLSSSPSPEVVSIWQQLTVSEMSYVNKLNILRTVVQEPISRRWPEVWAQVDALQLLDTIRQRSTTHLLEPLKDTPEDRRNLMALGRIFRQWAKYTFPVFESYYERYPRTASAIRAACEADPTFGGFIDRFNSTHKLDDQLRQPLRRLDYYCSMWSRAVVYAKVAVAGPTEASDFCDRIEQLRTSCEASLKESQHDADLKELHRRISALDPAFAETLDLLANNRRLVRQEPLACKAKAKGPWRPVRCALLDNYIFFGRWEQGADKAKEMWYAKMKSGGEKTWWYLEKPIPAGDVQVSISGVPGKPTKASVLDELPRGTELFPFFLQTHDTLHVLAAATDESRRKWVEMIQSARS